MKTLRQTNIKNSQNYFFNSMNNIKKFDPSLLSIDQIPFKGIEFFTYNTKYIKNIDSANSLYLYTFSITIQILSIHSKR